MPEIPDLAFAQTLLVEGADAGQFLQGQFTTQPLALAPSQWQFSAWLDAQGRVRYFFHLLRLAEDRWLVLLRGGRAAAMKEELSRFVFRSRLTMTADDSRMLHTGNALPLYASQVLDGNVTLGCGDHALAIDGAGIADDDWRLAHIRAGWPWLPDTALGIHLPPSLGLHRLDAVNLAKGCYPGQEIVARLHYRGGSKRQLCRFKLSQPTAADHSPRELEHDGLQWLDVVATSDGAEALGVCQRDVVAAWSDARVTREDRERQLQLVDTWDG